MKLTPKTDHIIGAIIASVWVGLVACLVNVRKTYLYAALIFISVFAILQRTVTFIYYKYIDYDGDEEYDYDKRNME